MGFRKWTIIERTTKRAYEGFKDGQLTGGRDVKRRALLQRMQNHRRKVLLFILHVFAETYARYGGCRAGQKRLQLQH